MAGREDPRRGGRPPPSSTTPILFPSGEDANPLNRRLPAEVVTRRRREVKKVEDKTIDDVKVDLKTALTLKPESRPKWLAKACKMAEEGRASTTELYNIISSRKFSSGLPPKIGRKLCLTVHENLGLFSDKQQRYLRSSEFSLNIHYSEKAVAERDGDEDDLDTPAQAEEVSARGSAPGSEKPPPPDDALVDVEGETRGRTAMSQQPAWMEVEDTRSRHVHDAEERARREAAEAEERARRKALEKEEQERWLAAEAEASRRRALEQQQARKQQLENEVDSSMLLLERLTQHKQQPSVQEPEQTIQESRTNNGKSRGGLSRSRSISSGYRSRGRRRSRSKSGSGRRGRRDGKKKRRRRSSSPMDRAQFSEALRRRMAEREAEMDTTRVPVVDPGHAQRWK